MSRRFRSRSTIPVSKNVKRFKYQIHLKWDRPKLYVNPRDGLICELYYGSKWVDRWRFSSIEQKQMDTYIFNFRHHPVIIGHEFSYNFNNVVYVKGARDVTHEIH